MKLRSYIEATVILCLSSHFFPGKALGSRGEEVKRSVLAVWCKNDIFGDVGNPILKHLEFSLNHLGLYIDYVDMDSDPMPDPGLPGFKQKYRGLLTFFPAEHLGCGRRFLSWLERYARSNLPWVAVGYLGILRSQPEGKVATVLSKFGVRLQSFPFDPIVITPTVVSGKGMHFERDLDPYLKEFPPISVEGTTAKVWLKLKTTHAKFESAAVFVSPKMSLAYGNYGLARNLTEDRRQWQVDPFLFFREAFALHENLPIADVSVISGRRVFLGHIDGDSFNSISGLNPQKYCGEIIESEILSRYPFLPFGVSFVVAEINQRYGGNRRLMDAMSRIARMPNVEVASHTYFHPLIWGDGKLSYGKRNQRLDEHQELVGSVKFLQEKMPPGKKVSTVYWPGDCLPTESALRITREKGMGNLNGGDSRYDSEYPSLAYLAPLGRPVGREFQVFSANANDNIYTDRWEDRKFNYRSVIETFKNTGEPRILKPINLYFHFFAGELSVSLVAVKEAIEWALKQDIAPVFPSQYIRSVMGYRSARIWSGGRDRYAISQSKGLHTLRVDTSEVLPDLERSKGIIGFLKRRHALYVHLDPGWEGDRVLALKPRTRTGGSPHRPYLLSVGGPVEKWSLSKNILEVEIGALTRGPLVIGGLSSSSVQAFCQDSNREHEVDGGVVSIDFPVSAQPQRLEVRF